MLKEELKKKYFYIFTSTTTAVHVVGVKIGCAIIKLDGKEDEDSAVAASMLYLASKHESRILMFLILVNQNENVSKYP